MKKSVRLVFTLLLVLTVSACNTPGALPESAIGRITALQGTPMLLRTNQFVELGPRATVEASDVIFTRPEQKLRLKLRGRLEITLGENSQLGIHDQSESQSEEQRDAPLSFSLGYGICQFSLGKKIDEAATPLEVSTRTGVVRIRQGSVVLSEDQFGEVSVLLSRKGRVELENDFGRVVMTEAGSLSVLKFASEPTLPQVQEQAQMTDALQALVITGGGA